MEGRITENESEFRELNENNSDGENHEEEPVLFAKPETQKQDSRASQQYSEGAGSLEGSEQRQEEEELKKENGSDTTSVMINLVETNIGRLKSSSSVNMGATDQSSICCADLNILCELVSLRDEGLQD